jgi:hypothetical protein
MRGNGAAFPRRVLIIPLRPKGHVEITRNAVDLQALVKPKVYPVHPSWLHAQECLRAHSEKREAQGAALREALRLIDDANHGPGLMEAWDARSRLDLAALGRLKPPTLRTIQLHLKRTRGERQNAQSNQRSELSHKPRQAKILA